MRPWLMMNIVDLLLHNNEIFVNRIFQETYQLLTDKRKKKLKDYEGNVEIIIIKISPCWGIYVTEDILCKNNFRNVKF